MIIGTAFSGQAATSSKGARASGIIELSLGLHFAGGMGGFPANAGGTSGGARSGPTVEEVD